jgi:replicative DNA helicase
VKAVSLRDAALDHAKRGRAVFPAWWAEEGERCGCGDPACTNQGKHPIGQVAPQGCKSATTDPGIVAAWWDAYPRANVGLATGRASGLWVLDIDADTPGAEEMAKLAAVHGGMPDTKRARTGGGGLHFAWTYDKRTEAWLEANGLELPTRKGVPAKGVDVRCNGGYIIAPPSLHRSGQRYEWEDSGPTAEAPEWLLRAVAKAKPAPREAAPPPTPAASDSNDRKFGLAVLRKSCERIAGAAEQKGNRHDIIRAAARTVGGFVAHGYISHPEAEAALIEAGVAIGKSEKEVRAVVRWGLDDGIANPLEKPPSRYETAATERRATQDDGGVWGGPRRGVPEGEEIPPPSDEDAPPSLRVVEAGESRRPDGRAAGKAAGEEWEAPAQLAAASTAITFPTHALPPVLYDFVEALAEETQTPVDLAAMFVLAVCGASVAGRVEVRAWGRYTEPLNLYVAAALPPGNRKSSVHAAVTYPLQAFEKQEAARLASKINESKLARKVAERRLKSAEEKAAKAGPSEADAALQEAVAAAAALDRLQDVTAPRLTVDDVTQERLVSLMAENGGRLALISAEGGVFDQMAGRYSSVPNLEVYLKGHAGDLLKVDRVGRPGEFIQQPTLTLALAVQPEVIRGLAGQPGFRGRGLLGRFLYSMPESLVGSRRTDVVPMPDHIRHRYNECIKRLLILHPRVEGQEEPVRVSLDDRARERFKAFIDGIEPRLGKSGDLAPINDWAAKLQGAVLRIAGIIHFARTVTIEEDHELKKVDEWSIEAAIEIGWYLLAHAQIAFGVMGAAEESGQARVLLDWLTAKKVAAFTAREAFNAHQGRFRTMEACWSAIGILSQHGYVRKEAQPETKGKGRPPSPKFLVNPAVHAAPSTPEPPLMEQEAAK